MFPNPQYNLSSLYNAILQASINAISVIEMSLLHHKNVYLNPQCNPTSLCIKEMQNQLPTDESGNLYIKQRSKKRYTHDVALVQRET